MKKLLLLLLLFVSIVLVSCNTNPTKTSLGFNYEGNAVSFFTNDTLITDSTIRMIKRDMFFKAKIKCQYPKSFAPNKLMISRVDSTKLEGLKEFGNVNIAFIGTIYFKSKKNNIDIPRNENVSLYYSERGEYLGVAPTPESDLIIK